VFNGLTRSLAECHEQIHELLLDDADERHTIWTAAMEWWALTVIPSGPEAAQQWLEPLSARFILSESNGDFQATDWDTLAATSVAPLSRLFALRAVQSRGTSMLAVWSGHIGSWLFTAPWCLSDILACCAGYRETFATRSLPASDKSYLSSPMVTWAMQVRHHFITRSAPEPLDRVALAVLRWSLSWQEPTEEEVELASVPFVATMGTVVHHEKSLDLRVGRAWMLVSSPKTPLERMAEVLAVTSAQSIAAGHHVPEILAEAAHVHQQQGAEYLLRMLSLPRWHFFLENARGGEREKNLRPTFHDGLCRLLERWSNTPEPIPAIWLGWLLSSGSHEQGAAAAKSLALNEQLVWVNQWHAGAGSNPDLLGRFRAWAESLDETALRRLPKEYLKTWLTAESRDARIVVMSLIGRMRQSAAPLVPPAALTQ